MKDSQIREDDPLTPLPPALYRSPRPCIAIPIPSSSIFDLKSTPNHVHVHVHDERSIVRKPGSVPGSPSDLGLLWS